ncbi:amphi-Trp domain-containing protein [Micrococcoides hystricis]|uniref:Amphi-Trp domain-containing protein n=1 Tax=Micrococcoides hystricis TaxID=1572761 RepID=A0ABV6P8F5_9MICC
MAREDVLLKAKERYSREQLADFLTGLAEQIRSGELTFVQGADTTEVVVPENVRVDIELVDELKRRGTKRELEVEIS